MSLLPIREIPKITAWSQSIALIDINNWGSHKYTKTILNDGTIIMETREPGKEPEILINPSNKTLAQIADDYYRQNGR